MKGKRSLRFLTMTQGGDWVFVTSSKRGDFNGHAGNPKNQLSAKTTGDPGERVFGLFMPVRKRIGDRW